MTLNRAGASGSLTAAQREDALSYLLVTALELYDRYDPSIGSFSGYLSRLLPLRATSWWTRERPSVRQGRGPSAVAEPLLESQLGASFALDDVAVVDGDDWQERVEERAAARAMIAELSPESRETIALLVVPLSRGETSVALEQRLGLSALSIRRRVQRVRAELLDRYRERTGIGAA